MEKEFKLASSSKKQWLDAVVDDIDSFLLDFADAERKASSTAMALVGKYPQHEKVISGLIAIATDTLSTFEQVYGYIAKRGLKLNKEMAEDLYVKQLVWLSRSGRKERFLDRLIIACIVELRGAERMGLVSKAVSNKQLKSFFKKVAEKKEQHAAAYADMLLTYFEAKEVKKRFKFFAAAEADQVKDMEVIASFH